MSDFKTTLEHKLQDPQFKAEWDTLELEYQIVSELIRSRIECDLTQEELSRKSGVRQSNISRIERGSVLPKLDTLEALAKAMGKKVKIMLV